MDGILQKDKIIAIMYNNLNIPFIKSTIIIFSMLHLPIIAYGQESRDPFEVIETERIEESAHVWDDQVVEANNAIPIKFTGNDAIRQNTDSVQITFSVDKETYLKSQEHQDQNRGVILFSGNPESPVLYCWMRPFMFSDKSAIFIVTVPRKNLDTMSLAFIPNNGRKRYLYKVSSVMQHFSE
jgi:hypothetical protein